MRTVSSDPLLESLRAAVEAAPTDVTLRLHFAEVLLSRGERHEAIRQAAIILQHDPDNVAALHILTTPRPAGSPSEAAAPEAAAADTPAKSPSDRPELTPDEVDETVRQLEAQLEGVIPPLFVNDEASTVSPPPAPPESAFSAESAGLRLDDVGGMTDVKAALEAGFLAPLRNPELVKLYSKSLRGGLLLYGPPGCGKTFIARAVAGEMGAQFLAVSLAEVLDRWIGASERNVHDLFESARSQAPCVIFLDEVDAIGQKRTHLRNSGTRGTVNQLLSEMDGLQSSNEGVYVLAATNHPWDVDVALRRPGRFDRTILVLPPDEEARKAILRYHLRSRPVANINLGRLARQTDGYSGADLAYICESASERALLDSARTGNIRMIEMPDLEGAIKDVRPSIGPWFETAKNVVEFGNQDGMYDDLAKYLRKRRL
jgi:SpoVK/Ycf46/Vps4 family AAA+-type ATPase